MGQKVNPIGFRVGVTIPWNSRWYAVKKNFGDWLIEDQRIRRFIWRNFGFAGISKIEIERIGEKIRVIVRCARPGLLIGKKGAKVDKLSEDVGAIVGRTVEVDIQEVETPELDAQIVGEAIAEQLERRAPYRRVVRRYAETVMQNGALGVKIMIKGRLGGAEIARNEHITQGTVPLTTLRAVIDYGQSTAILNKGTIGIKVWINKGEKFHQKGPANAAALEALDTVQPRRR
jgi:small subunit ribosomal protein S3